jgi:hypothetical protein
MRPIAGYGAPRAMTDVHNRKCRVESCIWVSLSGSADTGRIAVSQDLDVCKGSSGSGVDGQSSCDGQDSRHVGYPYFIPTIGHNTAEFQSLFEGNAKVAKIMESVGVTGPPAIAIYKEVEAAGKV